MLTGISHFHTSTTAVTSEYLLCYRWRTSEDICAVEDISEFVHSHGGHIEQLQDTVDFYIPDQYRLWLILKFPQLRAVPALDYLI